MQVIPQAEFREIVNCFKDYHSYKYRLEEIKDRTDDICLSAVNYMHDAVMTSNISDTTFLTVSDRLESASEKLYLEEKIRVIQESIQAASLRAPLHCRKKIRKILYENMINRKSAETIAIDGILVHKNTVTKYRKLAIRYAFEEFYSPFNAGKGKSPMVNFDYYYEGQSADKECYFYMPKMLMEYDIFSDLSLHAKILYVALLDLMRLSARNRRFIDDKGRVFVIMTHDKEDENGNVIKQGSFSYLMHTFRFSERSLKRYMKELEDFGLIEKSDRIGGFNNAKRIYVKDYQSFAAVCSASSEDHEDKDPVTEISTQYEGNVKEETTVPENVEIPESANLALSKVQNWHYRKGKNGTIESADSAPSYIYHNNIYHKDTTTTYNEKSSAVNQRDQDQSAHARPRDIIAEIPGHLRNEISAEEYLRASPEIKRAFSKILGDGGFRASESALCIAAEQCLNYGGSWFLDAVDVAVRNGRPTLAYTSGVLNNRAKLHDRKAAANERSAKRKRAEAMAEKAADAEREREFEEKHGEEIRSVQAEKKISFAEAKEYVHHEVNKRTLEKIRNGTLFKRV